MISPEPSTSPQLGVCEGLEVDLSVVDQYLSTQEILVLAQFTSSQAMALLCPMQPTGVTCQIVINARAAPNFSSQAVVCQGVTGTTCTLTIPLPGDGQYQILLQPSTPVDCIFTDFILEVSSCIVNLNYVRVCFLCSVCNSSPCPADQFGLYPAIYNRPAGQRGPNSHASRVQAAGHILRTCQVAH